MGSATRAVTGASLLCSFYGWAEEFELGDNNPARKLLSIRVPATVPKATPAQVFAEAIASADDRMRLMLLLAARAGLRRTEIATLHARHIGEDHLRITGKGGRTRHIPLDREFAAELRRAAQGGWVFKDRWGRGNHMTPGYVGQILKEHLGSGYSAHSLRHLFASKAYAGTRDLLGVQRLLGHSNPTTTQRYVANPDGALIAAVQAAAS